MLPSFDVDAYSAASSPSERGCSRTARPSNAARQSRSCRTNVNAPDVFHRRKIGLSRNGEIVSVDPDNRTSLALGGIGPCELATTSSASDAGLHWGYMS